jgi:predicted  nucleic acid-binding Zn-ribbon protein
MTYKATSECSYPDSENETLQSQISNIYERLMAVMKEEDDLRRNLEELLNRQEAEALEELKKAEENVATIRAQGERMRCEITIRDESRLIVRIEFL